MLSVYLVVNVRNGPVRRGRVDGVGGVGDGPDAGFDVSLRDGVAVGGDAEGFDGGERDADGDDAVDGVVEREGEHGDEGRDPRGRVAVNRSRAASWRARRIPGLCAGYQ